MGISNLLPHVKEAGKVAHVSEYRGKRVAVDAYLWLHKGAYGCAMDLALKRKTDGYVKYCMFLVGMLLHHNVRPIVVFDGSPLPAKRLTEVDRRKSRQVHMDKARAHLVNSLHEKAVEEFQKAIDITPEMALEFIKELRKANVDYIVAPYEADAQMAYLNHKDIVEAVITDDSDLLAFGCKKVLFKMDKFGNGYEIQSSNFSKCSKIRLHNWTPERFTQMCVLAGCDYLESVNGIGVIKANRILNRPDVRTQHDIIRHLTKHNVKLGERVPPDYAQRLHLALLAFKHQRVFDPEKEEIVPLHELNKALTPEEDSFIGPHIDKETAVELAYGNLNPMNLKRMDTFRKTVFVGGVPTALERKTSSSATPTSPPLVFVGPIPSGSAPTPQSRLFKLASNDDLVEQYMRPSGSPRDDSSSKAGSRTPPRVSLREAMTSEQAPRAQAQKPMLARILSASGSAVVSLPPNQQPVISDVCVDPEYERIFETADQYHDDEDVSVLGMDEVPETPEKARKHRRVSSDNLGDTMKARLSFDHPESEDGDESYSESPRRSPRRKSGVISPPNTSMPTPSKDTLHSANLPSRDRMLKSLDSSATQSGVVLRSRFFVETMIVTATKEENSNERQKATEDEDDERPTSPILRPSPSQPVSLPKAVKTSPPLRSLCTGRIVDKTSPRPSGLDIIRAFAAVTQKSERDVKNSNIVAQMVDMGFTQTESMLAVAATNERGLDVAVEWAFKQQQQQQQRQQSSPMTPPTPTYKTWSSAFDHRSTKRHKVAQTTPYNMDRPPTLSPTSASSILPTPTKTPTTGTGQLTLFDAFKRRQGTDPQKRMDAFLDGQ